MERPIANATAASRRAAANIALALGLAVVLSLALALGVAAVARADVPDVRYCSADSDMVVSPGGGFLYAVTLRDNVNQPVVNGTVVLDFTNAPGLTLCTDVDPDNDRRLLALTNFAGVARFWVKAGGSTTGTVAVGTTFDVIRRVQVATTDLDGNMVVDSADRSALIALEGTHGPAGDLDCNGLVDANDVALFDARLGNTCAVTAAQPMTWGRVKALFR